MNKYADVINGLVVNVIESEIPPMDGNWILVGPDNPEAVPTIGYSYDAKTNKFISPKPFPSWVLNDTIWYSPVPYPNDDKIYSWDEATISWKEVT